MITTKMPQIKRNSIYRRTVNKLNRDYYDKVKFKIQDGIPLFVQRMSNCEEMNKVYAIEAEKRYYERMLKHHIQDFRNVFDEVDSVMRSLLLIGTRKNISHHMFAFRVSEYLF